MALNSPHILLIEDDESLAELIQECLADEGFIVSHAATGEDAIAFSQKENFNLIVCDLMLPDIHGFELVKLIEYNHTCPLLFLTAMSDDQTHIQGLELGAADFIAKPVDPNVLIARVKANLRQFNARPDFIEIHEYAFNQRNKTLLKKQQPVALTNQEFDILWAFIRQPDKPLTREYLFQRIIGRDYDGLDRAIDLKISRLRKKLIDFGCGNITIDTIRGQGYVLTISASNNA